MKIFINVVVALPQLFYQASWLITMSANQSEISGIPYSEAYSEPSQTSKMKLFCETVNNWKLSTNFAKSSILDLWLGSENASISVSYHELVWKICQLQKTLILYYCVNCVQIRSFFLTRIFPHLDWIRVRKKLRIWTLFTQFIIFCISQFWEILR